MRISDWSSDVCSSDLLGHQLVVLQRVLSKLPDVVFAAVLLEELQVAPALALLSRLHQGPHRDLLALGELVFQGGRIGADERDRRLGGLQVQKPVALGEIEELALPMVQPAFWCVGLLIRLDPEIEAGQIWRLFHALGNENGRASCREKGCQYG